MAMIEVSNNGHIVKIKNSDNSIIELDTQKNTVSVE
jgi:hypothetical protein